MASNAHRKSPLPHALAELNEMGLPGMSATLDEMYRSPNFLELDPLTAIANLVEPEDQKKMNKRILSHLSSAHLRGCPQELTNCVDSAEREYLARGITETLSSLDFIDSGLNICILGSSDSGKSYLAKTIGIAACNSYKVEYHHCESLLEALVALKAQDYAKYQKRLKKICGAALLILDDFLLHTITDEREVKILFEILEKRCEINLSSITGVKDNNGQLVTTFEYVIVSPEDNTTSSEENLQSISFSSIPSEYTFTSGAGAWGTGLVITPDGSFEGNYHDSNMGEDGEGYPNGTVYYCNFSGKFSDPEPVNEYTYKVTLESFNTAAQAGVEFIEDGIKYIASEPYGFDGPNEYYIYLPGIPSSMMPENAFDWVSRLYGSDFGSYEVYVICSANGELPFVGEFD